MTTNKKKINWNKVTYWEKVDWANQNSIYLSRLDVWKLPMWTFHVLRKLAIDFGKVANFIRKVIEKYTDHYDIQDHFKFKNLKK